MEPSVSRHGSSPLDAILGRMASLRAAHEQHVAMADLTLYRWYLAVAGADYGAGKELIVNKVVMPTFADPMVRQRASCCYVAKYAPDGGRPHEVRMTVITDVDRGAELVAAVEWHVGDWPVNDRDCDKRGDLLCLPENMWYRRAIDQVTAVALDLHAGPIKRHRQFLHQFRRGAGGPGFSYRNVHAYLLQHSGTYRCLCSDDKATAQFWEGFERKGPGNLSYPGHWLEDAILGR